MLRERERERERDRERERERERKRLNRFCTKPFLRSKIIDKSCLKVSCIHESLYFVIICYSLKTTLRLGNNSRLGLQLKGLEYFVTCNSVIYLNLFQTLSELVIIDI